MGKRINFTKTDVDALEPREKPYHVFDAELRGLVLRVQPSGQKTYFLDYRRADGRRTRHKIGVHGRVSVEGARKLGRVAAGLVAAGVDVNARRKAEKAEAARTRAQTLRVFLEGRYKTWAETELRSGEFQVKRLLADFADWLEKPMTAINPWLIEGYRKKRREAGRSPKTINRELQRLRSAVAKAVTWQILDEHPFAAVKPLKTDRGGRVRYLSTEEEKDLRKALETRETKLREARDRFNAWREKRHMKSLPVRTGAYLDHLRPMVLLALNTGLRRGELLSLQWSDVNFGGKMLTVRGQTAKTGQTRRVPLNAEALEVLTAWRALVDHGPDDFVFPGAAGGRLGRVDRAWETALGLATLKDFRFHDLRHHFASRLVMEGVPLNTVRELLGHTSIEMTMRYAHLAPDNLAQAVEKLAGVRA